EELRAFPHRERQGDLRSLAGGERADRSIERNFESGEPRACELVIPARAESTPELECLGDGQVDVQRAILADVSDTGQKGHRVFSGIDLEHTDGPRACSAESDRELQKRRLSGAVGADEARN